MTQEGTVVMDDGVALLGRGDTVVVVYQAAARLHRTKWLFARIEEHMEKRTGDFLVLLVVLPTADIPDAATRAENNAGIRRLGGRLRRLVTAPVGDALRMTLVRAVMRAVAAVQGKSGVHFVARDIDDALRLVAAGAGPATPSTAQLRADLERVYAALDETR